MSRRGHNEGSIYQRADGRWTASVDLGIQNGRRKRKYLYGKTRRDVAELLKIALRDQQMGRTLASGRVTIGAFLDQWLSEIIKQRVRPGTFQGYESYVRLHLKPSIGHHQLSKLEPHHVQSMINLKLSTGLSARTVNYLRAILRSALNQALRWDLVVRNVATLVDPPRSKRFHCQPLTPEQVHKLLDTVRGNRMEALITVAIALGLRQGEALGLRWRDVDQNNGVIHIRHGIQKIGKSWQFIEPKTDQSRRSINMPKVSIDVLVEHKTRQILERAAAGDRWQDWNLVFPSAIGTPQDNSNATHRFQDILKRAELPRQRFHDLRHFCASLLLAQHVDPRVVMEILGHSQISLTMNTFAHVMPVLQQESASLMDAILTP